MDFDFFQYYSDELKRDKTIPPAIPLSGGGKWLKINLFEVWIA
jgi:hypothetical protein